ncbi:hypothetical protein [Streptomyces sp. NPDC093071]|uniref:hypothetical protein n=1 Tax=Streptomyces sp. NPDC093071 TaxID=3366022 RepID=UPI0038256849
MTVALPRVEQIYAVAGCTFHSEGGNPGLEVVFTPRRKKDGRPVTGGGREISRHGEGHRVVGVSWADLRRTARIPSDSRARCGWGERGCDVLGDEDRGRLRRLVDVVEGYGLRRVVEEVAGGGVDPGVMASLASWCVFDHVATLVFPDRVEDVVDVLRRWEFEVHGPVPSVVVRDWLTRRHGLDAADRDVSIVKARTARATGPSRGLEVFVFPRPRRDDPVAAAERRSCREDHFALRVTRPADGGLGLVRSLLVDDLAMVPDGGGHNPHEGAGTGGRSVLYFTASGGRLELTHDGSPADGA